MTQNLPDLFRVTLLGTGGPPPLLDRFGPSTLLEAGDEKFLFDAGRGAMQRLFQLKIPFSAITGLFLTHLHSDHVVGFPDLWLTGWINQEWGGRQVPLPVWGPRETKEMMSHLQNAYQFDIRIRTHYQKEGVKIIAEEFTGGVVYENNGLKIIAFEVDHGRVKPAYGYRIDYGGRSVVLSGDTRLNENVIRFSQGVDLLVHEVVGMSDEFLRENQFAKTIASNHSTAEDAGEVFRRANPKLAVYNHILSFGGYQEEKLIPSTRKNYSGPLEVGQDLMSIDIGEQTDISRPSASNI
ncbi:MAG: MBL fold metallo-hydrolase [Deltaproteobacteria bacterium]|nr:MBL fold metallo-hydrolase [Deltaproteobacteria bacterium]